MRVNRNVTFGLEDLKIVEGYMHKTRKNFSRTLCFIINQWDEFSVMMEKVKHENDADREADQIKHAEILHTDMKKTRSCHADIKRVKKK